MVEALDLEALSSAEVNARLKALAGTGARVVLCNTHAQHNLAVNVQGELEVEIHGSTGFYTCGFMNGPTVTVRGNVGWYAADNMLGGRLVVEKNAGSNLAPSMIDGTVHVHGSAGSRVGYGLKGGVVIVGGEVGMLTGQQMLGGRIVLLGRVGTSTGESMYGGHIYYRRGAVGGRGGNTRQRELDSADKEALQAIFAANGIEADPDEFVCLVPRPGKQKYHLFKPKHQSRRVVQET